jgi:hypothetical protein
MGPPCATCPQQPARPPPAARRGERPAPRSASEPAPRARPPAAAMAKPRRARRASHASRITLTLP